MRRTEKGIPILSWCLSVRNCESTLETCLKSLRERTPQAEIVIVDNMSRDGTPDVAKKYADIFIRYRGPKDNWTEDDPHTYDMAASRQTAFDSASGRWRAWVDSDDRVPGGEETEKLLKLNARWKPGKDNIVNPDAKMVSLEDLLLQVEEATPKADCIWAPYLYAKDENNQAHIWQERERIIKWSNPAKWRWAEAAHEILVPVQGYKPKYRIFFAHLLFVHERDHGIKQHQFAVSRHFDVLHRQYQENDRTTRRCLYLAAYSKDICPEREREFIDEAHRLCVTHTDRYRTLSASAALYARQGLFNDAFEALGAATFLRPDLPDVWLQGGEIFFGIEDFGRAAEWLEKGLLQNPALGDSYVNPRFHAIRYPTLLSEAYVKMAESHKKLGMHLEAKSYLDAATELALKVKNHSAIGEASSDDAIEANSRWCRLDNDRRAQEYAIYIRSLGEYLIANDEPNKAVELLKTKPWNLEDHPLLLDLEKKLRPFVKHVNDKEAYRQFYVSDVETGYIESKESWLDPDKCLPRVRWTADYLNTYAPNATVLDVGCYDGLITIPLLKLCPGIRYVGVDIYQKSVDKLNERLKQNGFDNRAHAMLIKDLGDLHNVELFGARMYGMFDAALWFEVIEHVHDPVEYLEDIMRFLKKDGKIFISTPWGSFDGGHPPKTNDHGGARDSRNHLRVLTARNIVETCEKAVGHGDHVDFSFEVEDLHHFPMKDNNLGDALHLLASKRAWVKPVETPTTFVVPGALWDWNGRTLEMNGMGASEKSIVQIASALAADYRSTEVYGPVPEETVYRGVPYWPLSQLRHVKEGKLVVSRNPSYAKVLDDTIGRNLPKILWLQDAWYNDLPEHWQDFEKIVVVSEWHRQAMHERHGVPLDLMEVIYNPIDARLYTPKEKPPRKSDYFVYCSSPDRGLIPLLRLWPKILDRLPTATLDIFYGFRGCQKLGLGTDSDWTKRYEACRREFESLRYQKGITVRDMVNPATLAQTFLSAGVWFYPLTDFHETCCTSALEARAAGCVPVYPPLAALVETAACDQSLMIPTADQPNFALAAVDAVVYASHTQEDQRRKMSEEAIERFRIEVMVSKWKNLLS